MRRHTHSRLTFALAALLTVPLAAPLASAQEDGPSLPIDWMEGCWQSDANGIREVWSPLIEGRLLFGYGLTTGKAGLTAFEQMRIEDADGTAVFIAMPNGGAPVRFTETDRSVMSITFENPDHDYPQRITYEAGRVALFATISKLDGSGETSFAYGYCRPEEDDAAD